MRRLKEDRLDKQKAYDKKVLRIMLELYCGDNHRCGGGLCGDCQELLDYASKRVDHCPLGTEKVTCAKCAIHCYDKPHKEAVRRAMRYSGPRLMLHHPIIALRHLFKEVLHKSGHRR